MKHNVLWYTRKIRGGIYAGSNRLSLILRLAIERLPAKRLLGLNLVGVAVFAGVVMPGAYDLASSLEVAAETTVTEVEAVVTEAKLRWPLKRFGISQRFSYFHPGMDLTDTFSTAVHPVHTGTVVWVKTERYGYGNHMLIDNGDGIQTLYAHLSSIDVNAGQTVTHETKLGGVGSTGWSTGDHLHLEIYEKGTPVNPVEVLPEIK